MEPSEKFLKELAAALVPLRRFAISLCRNSQDAEDLTQSTCERALSRWAQFEMGTSMDSWVFSIMHSIWKNQVRKQKNRQQVYAVISRDERCFDGEKSIMGKIALSEVLLTLDRLNEDQRVALMLVCVNGVSYKEAARILDVPQGTLESRIARGRIALGALLSEAKENEISADMKTRSKAGRSEKAHETN